MLYHVWRDGVPPHEDKVVFLTISGKWVSAKSPLFKKLVAKFANQETADDAAVQYKGRICAASEEVASPDRKPDTRQVANSALLAQFTEFDTAHPSVFVQFAAFTKQAIERGDRRLSYRAVLDRVKWDLHDRQVKVNGRFAVLYARKFVRAFPQFEAFYRIPKGWRHA